MDSNKLERQPHKNRTDAEQNRGPQLEAAGLGMVFLSLVQDALQEFRFTIGVASALQRPGRSDVHFQLPALPSAALLRPQFTNVKGFGRLERIRCLSPEFFPIFLQNLPSSAKLLFDSMPAGVV
jgi:hypothetical protein